MKFNCSGCIYYEPRAPSGYPPQCHLGPNVVVTNLTLENGQSAPDWCAIRRGWREVDEKLDERSK